MLMLMRNDGVFSADGAHTSAFGVSFYGGSGGGYAPPGNLANLICLKRH